MAGCLQLQFRLSSEPGGFEVWFGGMYILENSTRLDQERVKENTLVGSLIYPQTCQNQVDIPIL